MIRTLLERYIREILVENRVDDAAKVHPSVSRELIDQLSNKMLQKEKKASLQSC